MNNVNTKKKHGMPWSGSSLSLSCDRRPPLRGESATIARRRAAPGCASPGESGRMPDAMRPSDGVRSLFPVDRVTKNLVTSPSHQPGIGATPRANLHARRVINRSLLRRNFRSSCADIPMGLSGGNLVAIGLVCFRLLCGHGVDGPSRICVACP